MSAEQFGLLIAILGGIQTALSIWLKSTIEGAVKHKFDRELEIFKGEVRQRERAALIAELIAEWSSFPANPKRLNQLVIEANLWLPEQHARDLNRILVHARDAKNPKELIIDIRHLLIGARRYFGGRRDRSFSNGGNITNRWTGAAGACFASNLVRRRLR